MGRRRSGNDALGQATCTEFSPGELNAGRPWLGQRLRLARETQAGGSGRRETEEAMPDQVGTAPVEEGE